VYRVVRRVARSRLSCRVYAESALSLFLLAQVLATLTLGLGSSESGTYHSGPTMVGLTLRLTMHGRPFTDRSDGIMLSYLSLTARARVAQLRLGVSVPLEAV
jgi:hypothetical protein